MRVLLAEDERRLAEALARGLRREGMAVDVVGDGERALAKGRALDYRAVVLDRDLPGMHGDEVCRALASERPELRILMLTAAGSLDDLVDGLALGADDYIAKPFAFGELVARLRALDRRAGSARPPVLERGGIALDPARHTAQRDGCELDLSPKEFAVLELLLAADGATIGSDELLRRIWDENADPLSNTARMTVMALRRKLGDPPAIETVRGAGYRI